MLPDYCDTKDRFRKCLDRWLQKRVKELLGPLAGIPRYRLFEGSESSIIRPNGQEEIIDMMRTESKVPVGTADIPRLTLSDLLERLDATAQEMADQMGREFYGKISEAAESVGNVVNSAGKLTPEALHQGIRAQRSFWVALGRRCDSTIAHISLVLESYRPDAKARYLSCKIAENRL